MSKEEGPAGKDGAKEGHLESISYQENSPKSAPLQGPSRGNPREHELRPEPAAKDQNSERSEDLSGVRFPASAESERGTRRVSDSSIPRTDLGNARRLINDHGKDLRYCPQHQSWLHWDGRRWCFDDDGEVERRAKITVRSIHQEADREPNDDARKALGLWAYRSEYAPRIKAMVDLAKTEREVTVSALDLDRDPMLLCVENGVIDLKTGSIRAPSREDLITKQTHVIFDPAATCPTWNDFLSRVCNGDQKPIYYLQRIASYCLTGLTDEQCMFILWGPGENGKSVFIETLNTLFGDYSRTTPPETLMAGSSGSGASPDLVRLKGVRFVSAAEPDDGSRLKESHVKRLTGQDVIACRPLYGDFFEFRPQFKLFLATNHKPIIAGDSHAIWRRIHLIPLKVMISPEEKNKALGRELLEELPGILNWALAGLEQYKQMGLGTPPCVSQATAEYRSEMDIIGHWIGERCVRDGAAQTPMNDLYPSYRAWCQASNHRPFSKNRLGRRLSEKGFQGHHDRNGTSYQGLALRPIQTNFNSDEILNQERSP
jgi:putative DNA primase/helicase